MALKIDTYSENFQRSVVFIFNYLAKKMCYVSLSFCEEPEEWEKPCGHIIFAPYETLELIWPDKLAPILKEFLICIVKNNCLIKSFVYDDCEDLKTKTLRFVLKEVLKDCPHLHVLHLSSHYEHKSKFLIDLLGVSQIKELYIPEWSLSCKEVEKLLTFLKDYSGLEKLCISQNDVQEKSFSLLGEVASKPSMKELSMGCSCGRGIGMAPEDLEMFISGVKGKNPNMVKISFGEMFVFEKNWLSFQEKLHELLPNCEFSRALLSNESADALETQTEELAKKDDDNVGVLLGNAEVSEITLGEPLKKKQKRSEDAWGNTETNSNF
ncbi:MAG: hypothetical protein ACSW8C_00840 [bacterium]